MEMKDIKLTNGETVGEVVVRDKQRNGLYGRGSEVECDGER